MALRKNAVSRFGGSRRHFLKTMAAGFSAAIISSSAKAQFIAPPASSGPAEASSDGNVSIEVNARPIPGLIATTAPACASARWNIEAGWF